MDLIVGQGNKGKRACGWQRHAKANGWKLKSVIWDFTGFRFWPTKPGTSLFNCEEHLRLFQHARLASPKGWFRTRRKVRLSHHIPIFAVYVLSSFFFSFSTLLYSFRPVFFLSCIACAMFHSHPIFSIILFPTWIPLFFMNMRQMLF